MRAINRLSSRIAKTLSGKTEQHGEATTLSATPARRTHRVRYVASFIACIAVLALYSQLLGRDPIPPQNLPNVPPLIEDFVAAEGPVFWTFTGRVLDEDPTGLVITFGGLLKGHQTTVRDSQGNFWYSVELQRTGVATAQTVDDHGQSSNEARYAIL